MKYANGWVLWILIYLGRVMTKKENNSRSKVSKYTKNIEKDLVKTDKELSAALDGKRMF